MLKTYFRQKQFHDEIPNLLILQFVNGNLDTFNPSEITDRIVFLSLFFSFFLSLFHIFIFLLLRPVPPSPFNLANILAQPGTFVCTVV